MTSPSGPIAQSVEQMAFNHWVPGSSPGRITTYLKKRHLDWCLFCFNACITEFHQQTTRKAVLRTIALVLRKFAVGNINCSARSPCLPISAPPVNLTPVTVRVTSMKCAFRRDSREMEFKVTFVDSVLQSGKVKTSRMCGFTLHARSEQCTSSVKRT